MVAVTNYEVYVQDGRGNWVMHARYPSHGREDALEEAKEVEKMRHVSVRVMREIYYPSNNTTEENIIYSGIVKPRPASTGSLMKPGVAPVRAANSRGTYPSRNQGNNTAFAKKTSGNVGDFIFRLSIVLLLSALIAIVGTAVASVILKQLAISPSAQSMLLFGIFLAIFLISAVPLVSVYVPLDALSDNSSSGGAASRKNKTSSPPGTTSKSAMERANRNLAQSLSNDSEEGDKPRSPNTALDALIPVDEGAWLSSDTSQGNSKKEKKSTHPKKDKKDQNPEKGKGGKETDTPNHNTKKEDAIAEEKPTQKAAEEPPQKPHSPESFSDARMECMKFLAVILESVKTSHPNIDAYNRFGLNLYIAGACDHLVRTYSLNQEEKGALISQALEVIGTPSEQVRQIVDKLDTYRKEERYRAMIAAGLGAIRSHISGEADPRHAFGGIMKQWNTPQTQKLSSSQVTIVFTDMVNSTGVTQELGDAIAQGIIRAHNTIVRDALALHRGKEVKHTGDGIMATFDDALDAVKASLEIQKKAQEHTERWPKLPLHLRIGMNSGEPIIEENDYFGATVQIAARVCACARTGKVWLSESTKTLIPSFAQLYFFDEGKQSLKGVAEDITLFQASLQPPQESADTEPKQEKSNLGIKEEGQGQGETPT